jgi:hypothetical protein
MRDIGGDHLNESGLQELLSLKLPLRRFVSPRHASVASLTLLSRHKLIDDLYLVMGRWHDDDAQLGLEHIGDDAIQLANQLAHTMMMLPSLKTMILGLRWLPLTCTPTWTISAITSLTVILSFKHHFYRPARCLFCMPNVMLSVSVNDRYITCGVIYQL